ncbi:hypothetical protein G6F70_004730 [Rhizopus microsporus]|nr:hypothetical protein G6F71_004746 [Rhizopus microsporus]KAG1199646.1 hypothetical protein G6F70_004730 [Rhizopus microsporus]KAG1211405.1 hypothetical protein G6F69_004611 [Rhizopus microsporus]KAG1233283.1 hypothetical protein G6F67_004374 [Rhizopus microsporus]KAG1257804.1 hypothetical protein G6F68_009127 [Rhizopus microsporus]
MWKLGDDSTINHALCLGTLKLAILSRNSVLKHGHPIFTFQINVVYPTNASSFSPPARLHITELLHMIVNTTSKSRDCSVQ